MFKNILVILIPLLIYTLLFSFIPNQKDLILVTLLICTIIFWASSLLPDYQTSLIFLFTALAFSLSPKQIIFSGFSSSAFWLVLAGMLIAAAIKNVHLSQRFTLFFTKLKNPSYLKILIIISIFALTFSFIMPSGMGRVVLLIPLGIIIAKNFGFEEGSNGYIGILFTIMLSTSMPAFTILPANIPNMILIGLTNQIFDYELLYSHYLIVNFLILGLIKNILIVSLIYYFYKDTPKKIVINTKKTKISKNEKIVIISLIVMLLLWTTDFIHGISPSIVAIAGVLFLMNPSINIIKTKDINSINFSALIFLSALIGVGSISANNEFIKELLNSSINSFNLSDSHFLNYMKLNILMALSGVFLTQPTIPAIFTPMVEHLSNLSGFSTFELLMMQVAGFSTVVFPYQAPPLVIGLALANIKPVKMIKILLIITFVTLSVLFPLQYLWMGFIKNIL